MLKWVLWVQDVCIEGGVLKRVVVSGIHPEFSFPVIPDMFTYPERCPPALSVNVLTHPDP